MNITKLAEDQQLWVYNQVTKFFSAMFSYSVDFFPFTEKLWKKQRRLQLLKLICHENALTVTYSGVFHNVSHTVVWNPEISGGSTEAFLVLSFACSVTSQAPFILFLFCLFFSQHVNVYIISKYMYVSKCLQKMHVTVLEVNRKVFVIQNIFQRFIKVTSC